ncbi:MAG: hypothetical protein FD168_341 [Desulfobulbaceae bacterium]|nr:MAG: hypothetical protein FD168_341 [Desulfobulbaceae bacterium]
MYWLPFLFSGLRSLGSSSSFLGYRRDSDSFFRWFDHWIHRRSLLGLRSTSLCRSLSYRRPCSAQGRRGGGQKKAVQPLRVVRSRLPG